MYCCPNCGQATTPDMVKDGRCPHCPPKPMTDERSDPLKTAATIRAHDEAMTAALGRILDLGTVSGYLLAARHDALDPETVNDGRERLERVRSSIADMLTDYAATRERLAMVEDERAMFSRLACAVRDVIMRDGLVPIEDGINEQARIDEVKEAWQVLDDYFAAKHDAALRTTLEDGRDGP